MKSYLFLFLFLTSFCSADYISAQSSSGSNFGNISKNDWGSILRGNQAMKTKKREDIELRGTPFVIDDWYKGSIVLSDSLFSNTENKFKLDAEEHEIWIQSEKNDPLVLTDPRIIGLDLFVGSKTLSFRKLQIPDDKKNPWRYVQVLYKGSRFAFCKYVRKEFIPANGMDKGVAVVGRNYDSFETFTTYYTINDKKQTKKISLKRGDLYKLDLSLVEKNRDAINAFCKENNISNPLEEQDAATLIEFLETLK